MSLLPEVLQIIFIIGGMVVGLFLYLLDRQPSTIYFIPDWLSPATNDKVFLGHIGNSLKTFIHVYVFILLTIAVMTPTGTLVNAICATWATMMMIFIREQNNVLRI